MPIANIKDNLPLNELLTRRRRFLKIRLSDLEQHTGINSRYLKKIEKGEWPGLPSGVYARGFLRKYARAVGLDEGEIVFRYDREMAVLDGAARSQKNISSRKKTSWSAAIKNIGLEERFYFRKVLLLALAVLALGYVFWQFKPILERPSLELASPASEDAWTSGPSFKIAGRVSPGSALTINNETVYAETSGSFEKEVELLPGLNVLEIKAISRFGQETKIVRRINYSK